MNGYPMSSSPKKNPLKLNKLQLRTLALLQVLAKQSELIQTHADTGEVTITQLPHPHGDHMHIGPFVIASRDASGFDNPSVFAALKRKGLVVDRPTIGTTLSPEGLTYQTGLEDKFIETSDH